MSLPGNIHKVLQGRPVDWKLTNALLSERETLGIEEKQLTVREGTLFYPADMR
jgi:hypothetical protein